MLFFSDFDFIDPELEAVFTNPLTGARWRKGDNYTRQDLADTLGNTGGGRGTTTPDRILLIH